MHNPFYPQYVSHPLILIPKSWLGFDVKYWPVTQMDHTGTLHTLDFTYDIHYLELYELIELNQIGHYIEGLGSWAWNKVSLSDFDIFDIPVDISLMETDLMIKKAKIGALSLEWFKGNGFSLEEIKHYFNLQTHCWHPSMIKYEEKLTA